MCKNMIKKKFYLFLFGNIKKKLLSLQRICNKTDAK